MRRSNSQNPIRSFRKPNYGLMGDLVALAAKDSIDRNKKNY